MPPHLVEVEYEVELAHVAEEAVQHLHEQVDGLQVRKLVVRHVHAEGEEQARVPAVDDLVRAELRGSDAMTGKESDRERGQCNDADSNEISDWRSGVEGVAAVSMASGYIPGKAGPSFWSTHLHEVGELGVSRGNQSVNLIFNLSLVRLLDGNIPLGQARLPLTILQQEEPNLRSQRKHERFVWAL
jgi:hypothetical protein